MMYKQGDIVIIPFPFSDLSQKKKRPALVISNNEYNEKTEDILVTAITSKISTKDFTIDLDNDSLESGYLKYKSQIRADKIYTISKRIILKKYASVKVKIIQSVIQKVNELLNDGNK